MMGGLDKRVMSMDRTSMDKEIERAIQLIKDGRYIPGPDHGVLTDVPWKNYKYFMERLKEIVVNKEDLL